MEWTAEVTAGDWLRERLDDPWHGTMHDVVPHGFDAYARVFHPVERERPVGRPWPADGESRAWEDFLAQQPEVDTEHVTWQQTADAFGTTMHPLARWRRLVRGTDPYGDGGSPRDDEGWRYSGPQEGGLDTETLTELTSLLIGATATPDAGYAAVWEGWGDLVGGMRTPPSRSAFFGSGDGLPRRYAEYSAEDSPDQARHRAVMYRSLKDVFNNPFRRPTWHPGILSDEISRGPRLRMPNRDYVLFRGAVSTFVDPKWEHEVPWSSDHAADDEQRWRRPADAPALVWPDDHAWVMVSEVDWDFTVVAGSTELVNAIVADPRLEAASITEGADLSWNDDEVNR